jgi:hypothetical protein
MWFLLNYDRQQGVIVTLSTFSDFHREQADEARLNLELKLSRENVEREIVLLEAEDEAALRKTHQRYFAKWDALARSASLQTVTSEG